MEDLAERCLLAEIDHDVSATGPSPAAPADGPTRDTLRPRAAPTARPVAARTAAAGPSAPQECRPSTWDRARSRRPAPIVSSRNGVLARKLVIPRVLPPGTSDPMEGGLPRLPGGHGPSCVPRRGCTLRRSFLPTSPAWQGIVRLRPSAPTSRDGPSRRICRGSRLAVRSKRDRRAVVPFSEARTWPPRRPRRRRKPSGRRGEGSELRRPRR